MHVLTADEIRAWDDYTIQHEPIFSIDLMERAAGKCVEWIKDQYWENKQFKFFCGKGNNGGDGLAIARILFQENYPVSVFILDTAKKGSEDFEINLQRLHEMSFLNIYFIKEKTELPLINTDDILIDALFGSGLNKPLTEFAAEVVDHINHSKALVISIDLPSGLFSDQSSIGNVVEADHTLTFQCYKPGLLVQENGAFIGEVHVLDIGLHPDFLQQKTFKRQFVSPDFVRQFFKPRNRFAHKGSFGHALLIAGSYGKIGAAVLAARACLHSGVGLLTCYIPKCGYEILQTSVPEAMTITGASENIVDQLPEEIEKYSVIGIGPGIGTADETQKLLSFIIRRYQKSLVIDADGLNCLSLKKESLIHLPPHSVITPHPKEFDRLFGEHQNDFDRIQTAEKKATELNIIIVLKSHHTLIASPSGQSFFNSTGNAGMAKGGSGDVLTGIITSFVAQKYTPDEASILGVYLHGLAGDYAANDLSKEAMTATNIIDALSQAFHQFN